MKSLPRSLLIAVAICSAAFCLNAQAQTTGRALVRHAPTLNGTVEGSIQQMTAEGATLNGNAAVTGDLLVPGTPTVRLNGHPAYGGTLDGTGGASPSNYQITLNGNSSLRNVVRRTNPVALPTVSAPPLPTGTRSVNINSASDSPGSFATLRNLTLNGNVGQFAVPAGTYGDFTANGGSGFTLGVAGATQPAVYNFQHLTLNGQTQIQLVGPVVIALANGFSANGTLGSSATPSRLTLNVYSGGFTLNGGCNFYGYVNAPNSTVIVNGNSQLIGGVTCDRLTVNGNGLLRLVVPTSANHAPVANNSSVTLAEDASAPVTLSAADADGNTLSYTIVTPPLHGTLTPSVPFPFTFTFTPHSNYSGPDSFTFKANDGQADSNIATVSLTVTPVNDAPVATPQTVATAEDTPLSITLTATDVEGSALTYTIVTPPLHGTLTPSAPFPFTFTFTPAPNYAGPDSFSYVASDGALVSTPAVVAITVRPVPDAPVALGRSYSVNEGSTVAIALTGTDADGDSLTFNRLTSPVHGTLTGTAPNFTYQPDPNFEGTDSFTFTAFDGQLTSAPATITINAVNLNFAPVAHAGSATTDEDVVATLALSATDQDGDPLTFSVVTPPAHGSLSPGGSPSTFTFTPAPNYAGPDTFTFKANDGKADSNVATFSLTLRPVNDAPVATPQTLATAEDTPLVIVLAATDVEDSVLTYTIVTPPLHGTLTPSATFPFTFTFTPAPNYAGPDGFTFKVNDGALDSLPATVSLTVTPVNDAPVATPQTLATPEDTPLVIVLAATDVEDSVLTYTIVTPPLHGTLTPSATFPFTFTFTPAPNYAGPDGFTFKVNDGALDSAEAAIALTVTPQNDAPVATGQELSQAQDTPFDLTLSATDADGDELTYRIVTPPAHGALTPSVPGSLTPNFTYTPDFNYRGDDTLEFVARDAEVDSTPAIVKFTMLPVSHSPTAPTSPAVVLDEDGVATITLTATDLDGDALSYFIVTPPQNGTLSPIVVGPDNVATLAYTLFPNANGSDQFSVRASDGALFSDPATVVITVIPINDAPTATSASVETDEDTPLAITLTATDVEGSALTYAIVTPPAHGILTPSVPFPFTFTFTPAPNYAGPDSFTFKANDGQADSAIATVNIVVRSVNDAPTVALTAPANATTVMLGSTVTLMAVAADSDGTIAKVEFFDGAARLGDGTADAGQPSTFTLTFTFTTSGSHTLTARATDDAGAATTSTPVTITVNAPPVANPQTVTATQDTALAITLTGSDPEGSPLTYTITTPPAHGTLTPLLPQSLPPTFTFTPAPNYTGPDSFTFKVNDGTADSAPATVTIAIVVPNAPPVVDAGPDKQLAFVPHFGPRPRGRIIVNNDEWALTDQGFASSPNAGRFTRNLADFLTGGKPGANFLAYTNVIPGSVDFIYTGQQLAAAMAAAGHSWTTSSTIAMTLDNLLQYDAVFLGANVVDNQVLIDYVEAGGSVYLSAGTHWSGGQADVEAALWNTFLEHFGLHYGYPYNGITGTLPVSSDHPLFHGVSSLYFANGNSVFRTASLYSASDIVLTYNDQGLFGVFGESDNQVFLYGSVTDDGNPNGVLSWQWSQASGPAGAVIEAPTSLTTRVRFTQSGVYVLRLTATDGAATTSKDVTITLNASPVIDAGANFAVRDSSQPVTLTGTMLDDGILNPTSTQWTLVSGPGTAAIASPNSLSTQVTVGGNGIHTFRLSANDGLATSNAYTEVRAGLLYDSPVPPQIAAWWPGNGGPNEVVHGGHDVQPIGGAGYTSGKVASAFAFDGVDGYGLVKAHPDLDIGTSAAGFTIEFWINVADSARNEGILEWQNGVAIRKSSYYSERRLIMTLPTAGDLFLSGDYFVPTGWLHVALTYDRTTGVLRTYRNGLLLDIRSIGTGVNFGTNGDFLLAHGIYGRLNGQLDEVALYTRPLSGNEILAIYNANTIGKSPPNTVAPVVNAGPDIVVADATGTAVLHGTASPDDGPQPLVIAWSQLAGSGIAHFADPASTATTATFDAPGVYALQLTADNGLIFAIPDTVVVRVGVRYATGAPAGLAAWWPANGEPADVVHGGHDVQFANGAGYAAGQVALGFTYDGISQYGFVPAHSDLNLGASALGLSLEFWVKPDTTNNRNVILWSNGINSEGVGVTIGNNITCSLKDTSGTDHSLGGGTIQTGVWQHIVVTYDRPSGQAQIFRNGDLAVQQNLGSFTPQTTYDLYFGAFVRGAQYFKGGLDEISLYTRALSPTEALLLYRAGTFGKSPLDAGVAPVVSAGPDLAIPTAPGTVTLAGIAGDDGLPFPLTVAWSQLDGPGTATFAHPNQAATSATFDSPGLYTLKLQADDGLFSPVDFVSVRVGLPPSATAPDGLVAWWTGNNTTLESVRGLYNAELQNGAGFVPARVGSGFHFDGVNDRLKVAANPDSDLGAYAQGFTIELWVKPDTITYGPLLNWQNGSTDGLELWTNNNSNRVTAYLVGYNGGVLDAPGTIEAGVWQHIALTYDQAAGVVNIYKNGVSVASRGLSTTYRAATNMDLYIGGNPQYPGNNFAGTLDEISLYDRPLGAAEIASIYNADTAGKFVPPTNLAPAVNAGADQTAYVNMPLTLTGTALDDGLPNPPASLTYAWSVVSSPAGSAPPTATGPVINGSTFTFTFTFTSPGTYALRLSVSDSLLTGADDVSVTVTAPPSLPPAIAIYEPAAGAILPAGTYFEIAAHASDPDGTVAKVEFFQGATKLGEQTLPELGHPTTYFWPMTGGLANGTYTFTAKATDNSGVSTTSAPVTVEVTSTPSIADNVFLATPEEDSRISAPTTVTGVVASPFLASWALDYRLKAAEGDTPATWTTFATGTTPVGTPASDSTPAAPGTLGVFDTTLLLNGIYEVRLSVTETSGSTLVSGPISLIVEGNMKIGAFTLAFEDLKVPLAGIPITITRTYDSRDSRVGDFGPGWRLALANIRVQKNRNLGLAWWQTPQQGDGIQFYYVEPLRDRIVTIVMPDGETHRFRAGAYVKNRVGDPDNASFAAVVRQGLYKFYPVGDTTSTLEPLDASNQLYDRFWLESTGDQDLYAGEYGDFDFIPYNPSRFRLTTKDGAIFLLDERLGLLEMRDLNGNTLVLDRNGQNIVTGVTSTQNTAGGPVVQTVTITRNASGLVTAITDLANNSIAYSYDGQGRLTGVTDRENKTAQFLYELTGRPYYLTRVINTLGVQAIRTEYDASGRLVKQFDAQGNPVEFIHDPAAFRQTVKDRLGNATVHEFDDRGNITKTTDALGGVTTFVYDADNNLTARTDLLGYTTTSTYDARGNKLTEADPLGHTTTFTYNALSQPLTITDARGNTTQYAYDVSGNPTQIRDALNQVSTFTYDQTGNLLTQTDALGNVTSYNYGAVAQPTKITVRDASNAVLSVTDYTYDANGRQTGKATTRTTPSGVETLTTTFEYDAEGRLTKTTYPDGTTTRVSYDAIGRAVASTDQLNRTTSREYDVRGNLAKITYPDGAFETFGYDAENRQTTFVDRGGRTTTTVYDTLGRKTAAIHPGGASVDYLYDAAGRLTGEADERANATLYTYDNASRRIRVTDALGHATNFAYDANGNQVSVTDALGRVTAQEFDAGNRLAKVTYPDSTTRQTTYDALGRRLTETDESGNVTRFAYDGKGRLVEVRQYLDQSLAAGDSTFSILPSALGVVSTRYQYDEMGNQVAQIDGLDRITRYEYDAVNRRIKRTLPLGQSETMAYDAAGNLTAKADFNGHTTTFAHDAMNRLTQRTPDAPLLSLGALKAEFAWNASGLRIAQTLRDGANAIRYTESYSYDERNRLAAKTTPWGTLAYGHDAHSNLASLATDNGTNLSYAYDSLNRLSSVGNATAPYTATAPAGMSYSYNEVGSLASLSLMNGVATAFAYDTRNRLMRMTAQHGGATIADYQYTLDATGQRTALLEQNSRQTAWNYDFLHRLTSESIVAGTGDPAPAGSVGYSLDSVGNRLSRTSSVPSVLSVVQTYDSNDRIAGDTYDANGNTVSSLRVAGGMPITVTDTYDDQNRLIQRTDTAGNVINILYDADGNRVAKTVNGATTYYLVDTQNLTGYAQVIEELESVGSGQFAVRRSYAYGLDLISQAVWQSETNSWQVSYFGYDAHGTVRHLTDTAGNVTDAYAYDAYGNLVHRNGVTPNRYLYTGEQFDEDLGLYFLRARYLNPDSGRFWSQDSFEGSRGEPMSLHKYSYVFANPINGTDPSGNFTLAEVMETVGVVGTLTLMANMGITSLGASAAVADADGQPDAAIASVSEVGSARGVSGSVGFDVVLDFKSGRTYAYANFSAGLAPLSYFKAFRNVVAPSVTAGLIWNLNSPNEWSGSGVTATWPGSIGLLLAKSWGRTNPMWGALSQLAKREHNIKWSDYVIQVGVSTSGPAALKFGLRSNSFTAEAGIASEPVDITALGEAAGDVLSKVNIGALSSLQGDLGSLKTILK